MVAADGEVSQLVHEGLHTVESVSLRSCHLLLWDTALDTSLLHRIITSHTPTLALLLDSMSHVPPILLAHCLIHLVLILLLMHD